MQAELIPSPGSAIVQSGGSTPAKMMELAMGQNCDIDKLMKLWELQKDFEAVEARKAFTEAMAAFKSEAIVIPKNKVNTQYNSRYTTLGAMVNTVTPFLSRHGLSASWDIDQSNGITVTCTITHKYGGCKSVSMTCPADKSGAKNPIQEIKSAITYAKACTFESACGLASTDANVDDDGNGAGGMDKGVLGEQIEWIQNASSIDELQKLSSAAWKLAGKDEKAKQAIIEAKDKRKAELQ